MDFLFQHHLRIHHFLKLFHLLVLVFEYLVNLIDIYQNLPNKDFKTYLIQCEI